MPPSRHVDREHAGSRQAGRGWRVPIGDSLAKGWWRNELSAQGFAHASHRRSGLNGQGAVSLDSLSVPRLGLQAHANGLRVMAEHAGARTLIGTGPVRILAGVVFRAAAALGTGQ